MTLAIEPMVNEGGEQIRILKDGWTAVTADRSDSAHFEHVVLITEGDPEILTQSSSVSCANLAGEKMPAR
jgi:methionyl aminopeptidase